MYSHALTYPSLRVRRSFGRRHRARFFLPVSTQHVRTISWPREIVRAALALLNVAVWAALLFAL